ncbi:uncharacterized protein TEOVI_000176100 [Trypanosoma equiperdum]|uniref:Uncharacterized protein n=4 Tax=Trypanozoon TaxID=39700 RepID=Q381L6_TRYB2|nr:hypothetical protein, conserved [Trypanosoma brucei gambiense DAL972]XP_829627.1 hypothetical protein, conserved [Trypanosoma brucei brucei TREU927]RHW67821.1 hypothetical protein DPX39_110133000 [Trypanosoma brucei equiperdum]SCU70188.1 hypothetical protein, conserved [Trypanosoma equiperdum]EAN80515.1 hypothetical protein, conserved [Trypanosoma brucei brucei TREU927]CBH18641.1 hypothetical protein, conserved [Trypanosoma brucei gambiense DAL972]|eukprot:XP_011780905.1 hypothetical protein, conserved [Trypanosoma brucei gambiense DAL972]
MSTSITNFVKRVGTSLQHDVRTFTVWDPIGNKVHCAARDAVYLVMDCPKFFMYTHGAYGAMRRYIRQARINKGKVNPEDFRDVDTNVLRESLIRYAQWKGPLQKIDFRVFYWMYVLMIGYVFWQGLALNRMLEEKIDRSGVSLDKRRSMFDDDYEEDLRPQ